jgi:hypothetical protein
MSSRSYLQRVARVAPRGAGLLKPLRSIGHEESSHPLESPAVPTRSPSRAPSPLDASRPSMIAPTSATTPELLATPPIEPAGPADPVVARPAAHPPIDRSELLPPATRPTEHRAEVLVQDENERLRKQRLDFDVAPPFGEDRDSNEVRPPLPVAHRDSDPVRPPVPVATPPLREPRVRIGSIEIRIEPPPRPREMPAVVPVETSSRPRRTAATAGAPLSRGYASWFGIRQG